MVDWAEAGRVAGIGFGVVFLVLFITAIAIHIMGIVLRRFGIESKNKASNQGPNKK